MKVYITSASLDNTEQSKKLKKLWALSSKKHTLCEHHQEADLVVVADISRPNWFCDLRKNQKIKNPRKCFVIADSDYPMPLLHGVYTSNHKYLKFQSRFRTGAYNLFPEKVHNSFVAQASGDAYLSRKEFLYSFHGQDSSPLRLKLFQQQPKRSDVLVVNMTSYFNAHRHKENHFQYQKKYCDIIDRSKFVLCPKGTSGASIRLFEVMKMGVAPVIISDDWVLPQGPQWEEFAVFVREKDLHQIETIIEQREEEYQIMGKKAHEAYQKFFADEVYFDYLIDQLLDIQQHQKIPEYLFWSLRNVIVKYWMLKRQWTIWKK